MNLCNSRMKGTTKSAVEPSVNKMLLYFPTKFYVYLLMFLAFDYNVFVVNHVVVHQQMSAIIGKCHYKTVLVLLIFNIALSWYRCFDYKLLKICNFI